MNERDVTRLSDMLRFARAASGFVKDVNRDALDTDIQLQLALIKAIELIGEAASQIGRDVRSQNPQLPWRAMIGMRHILVHEYFSVDLDVLWDTVQVNLPDLIIELEKLIARLQGPSELA